jgi:hypothetical protein
MVIIAACSSSAHQLLDLLSRQVFLLALSLQPSQVCSARSNAIPGIVRRKDTQPVVPG